MGSSKLFRILSTIISFVIFALAIVIAIHIGIRLMKDTRRSIDEEQAKIEAEYNDLHEENTDEETGKKILTDNFLKKEYKNFYVEKKGSVKTFKSIVILFLVVAVLISVVSGASEVIRSFIQNRTIKLLNIVTAVGIAVALIAGMIFLNRVDTIAMVPKPEDVEIKVYAITVKGKHEHTTTDSDGDDHTEYYIELPSGNHKVTSAIYYGVDDPGYYYLVQYEGKSKVGDFAIYSANEYVKEAS